MTDRPDGRDIDGIDRHLGARIRDRRRAIGISQSKLAEALGLSFQQIQKYEIGANRVSAAVLWRISQVLAVAPGYWFDALPTSEAEAARHDQAAALLFTDDGQALARAYAAIGARSARLALIGIAEALAAQPFAESEEVQSKPDPRPVAAARRR